MGAEMNAKLFFDGFKKGFKDFGHNISIIVNSALLVFVYLIGVGITSVVAKLASKHFLDTKRSKSKSYWSELNLKRKPVDEYYRQF